MKRPSLPAAATLLGPFVFISMLLLVFSLPLCAETDIDRETSVEASLEAAWGIQILGIRSTAADYMLDFRYRVVNAEKAKPLFRRKSRPQLIDQSSGSKMGVYSSPKTGPMRSSDTPKVDRNYFILFANPGRHIEVGSKVTVVIDDFRVEDLTVQ